MAKTTWRPGPKHAEHDGQRPAGTIWILAIDDGGRKLSRRYINDAKTMGVWWKRVRWWIREADLPVDLPEELSHPRP